jgi:hypothetical protein
MLDGAVRCGAVLSAPDLAPTSVRRAVQPDAQALGIELDVEREQSQPGLDIGQTVTL